MTKISDLTALTGASVDDAADLLPIVDMSETGAARNKKITIDETRIALGLSSADSPQFTGLNLGHATDTTITRVSAGVVAIEGANIVTTAGGVTFAADIIVPDEAYDATNWDGNLEVPTKNAVRDKIESLSAGSGVTVEDEGVSEGTGITTLNFSGAGCSVTVVGAEAEIIVPGGGSGIDVEDEGVSEATGATILNFTGAGVTATDVGAGQVDIDIPGGSGTDVSRLTSITTITGTPAATTETDLLNYTLPAGTLASNGQAVRIQASGTLAATTRSRTVRLYFGSTVISTVATTNSANIVWKIDAMVIRVDGTNQRVNAIITLGTASAIAAILTNSSPTETLSGALSMKVTGQSAGAAVADDVVGNFYVAEFLP